MREWAVRLRPLLRLLAVLLLFAGTQLGLSLALGGTAMAAERVIEINLDGPKPVTLTGVKVGDTIAFKNTDAAFPHTVKSTSPNWSFDATINPNATFKVPTALKAAGKYTYADNSPLEDYAGEVQVTATTAKPPTRKPTPRPTRTTSGEPSQEPSNGATPTDEPTGGSGQAQTPPLIGGGIPTPSPGSVLPPPVTAPEPTGTDGAPQAGSGTVALPGGNLPEPPTPREYGLPTAVATVGAAGTASLLVRFLLAHPAGRRRLDAPIVTLDEPRTG